MLIDVKENRSQSLCNSKCDIDMSIDETKSQLFRSIIKETLRKYETQKDDKLIETIIEFLTKSPDQSAFTDFLSKIIEKPLNIINGISNDIYNNIFPNYYQKPIDYDSIEHPALDILNYPPRNKRIKHEGEPRKIEYVLYIAGLEPHQNQIDILYSTFSQYGKIMCIFTETKQRYALIQYCDLNSIFLAVSSAQKIYDNNYIRIGYATDVEEVLEQLSNDPKRTKTVKNKILAITAFAESLEKEGITID